jgi:ADP-heptose:LPS heptosyltransferase
VVVPQANVGLFAHSPHLDAVIPRPVVSWWGKMQFIREVRRQQFDLVVSFQEKSIFYALTARFGGARHSLSLRHWRTERFYQETVPWPGSLHRVERYLALAAALGAPVDAPGFTEIHLTLAHRARAAELLAGSGAEEGDLLVALHPGSTERSRRWEPAQFAALGDAIAQQTGARVLLLGGTQDETMAREIARAMRMPAINLAGRTGLLETGALLERCAIAVSGDTGPLHMAAALGTSVLALFGPSDPDVAAPRFGVAGGRARIVKSPGACARCSAPCLHTITVEECAAAALDLLAETVFGTPRAPDRRRVGASHGA